VPELLEWTVGNVADPDEPVSGPLSPRPAPSVSQRTSWIIACLIVATLVALAGFAAWNSYHSRQLVQQVIASEELAGRNGDVGALWSIADPDDWTWRKALLQLAVNHQVAPLPASVLQSLPDAPESIAFTTLAQDQVRADVTRSYWAPDGATLAFTLPQFYHYAQGQWKRLAPPAEWTKTFLRTGAHASITYQAADAGFVEGDLAPYLDDVLQRACAEWTCPPNTTIKLQLGSGLSLPISPDQPYPLVDEPLLFAFVRAKDLNVKSDTLLLPAPHLAGYPANAPANAWLKRAIALQALTELATRLTLPGGSGQSANAFLYALVARSAARLGLESSQSLESATPNGGAQISPTTLSSNVNAMWDMNLQDPDGQPVLGLRDNYGHVIRGNDPAARDLVLRSALAVTNWLLRPTIRPTSNRAEDEFKLLHAIASAYDQVSWVSHGLGVSPDEAWARLQLAVWNTRPTPPGPQLALTCSVGLFLASPSQTLPTFADFQSTTPNLLSYSPDGRHLLIESDVELIVIDLDTGAFTHLPAVPTRAFQLFRGWLSNTIVASLQPDFGAATPGTLHFFDIADPGRELPTVANIADYNLSPDKTRAAVINSQSPSSVTLAVMPARGGILKPIDEAVLPISGSNILSAWSSDSRALAYTHFDPISGQFSLRVADASTGLSHDIFTSRDPDAASLDGFIAWSALGGQIAFALQGAQPRDSPAAWLGVVNADGSGLKLLRQQNAIYAGLGFSADGQYLAATYNNSYWDTVFASSTVIYAVADSSQVRSLPNTQDLSWSPSGHQLAIAEWDGVNLIADFDQPQRQILAGDFCSNIIWKPAR
jgi:hypothetical protein